MIRTLVLLLSVIAAVSVFAGCGGKPAGEGAGEAASGTDAAEASGTAELSETITLAPGWEINDALSPAEVEAVMGRTGFQTWAECLSDAAAGKPQGSFFDGSLANSKVFFLVYCAEGQANYDRVLDFVESPVEISNDLWDQGVTGKLEGLDAILVRRGDVCIRIGYDSTLYPELDPVQTLVKLTELIIDKLYAPR